MPETEHARKIMRAMQRQYGKKKGEEVYYATANKQGRDFADFRKERIKKHLKKGK